MSTQSPEDREALRREIQAAIAAGRELDPEMDGHLADSALERYTKEQDVRDRARGIQKAKEAQMPRQPNPNLELVVRSLGTAVIIGGIIAAVVLTHGEVLGFFGLLFFLGPVWGWRGRRWSRRGYYYQSAQGAVQPPDDEEERRQREAKRQRKIEQLESEIQRLKDDKSDYV
jgi:hypothetical protein